MEGALTVVVVETKKIVVRQTMRFGKGARRLSNGFCHGRRSRYSLQAGSEMSTMDNHLLVVWYHFDKANVDVSGLLCPFSCVVFKMAWRFVMITRETLWIDSEVVSCYTTVFVRIAHLDAQETMVWYHLHFYAGCEHFVRTAHHLLMTYFDNFVRELAHFLARCPHIRALPRPL